MHPKFTPSQFRLMYVTQGKTIMAVQHEIKQVLDGGCQWIQIRMKEAPLKNIEALVLWALPRCIAHNAILLVNDYPRVAYVAGAHGVHLGKDDMSVALAKTILPHTKIVGGTANRIDDLERLHAQNVDYAGIGPFRFTETKQRLSPLLGIDGYRLLMDEMGRRGIQLPFVAIGGITLSDIPHIRRLGIPGIAVSGLIAHAADPVKQTQRVVQALETPLVDIYYNHRF